MLTETTPRWSWGGPSPSSGFAWRTSASRPEGPTPDHGRAVRPSRRESHGDRPHVTPSERSGDPPPRPRRDPARAAAVVALTDYLAAVANALRAEGFQTTHSRVEPGPILHARLTAVPSGPAGDRPARVTLAWAEDTGWSVTHSRLRGTASPWRYLHSRLVPAPAAVAAFVTLVITDTEDLAMLYPAQFRRHTEPVRLVLDALAEHGCTAPQVSTDPFDHPESR
jgi:Family of unknown function (DUF6292)